MERATDISQEQREQLGELADQLSAPDALSQLLQALDEAPSLPPQAELAELFDELRPSALGTVFLWLSKSQNDPVRPLLEAAAGRLAAANTAELVRLIQAPEPDVSSEAIRRAGALKAQAAVLALGKVLGEPDARAAAARGARVDGDRVARRAAGARARDRGRRPRRAHHRRARALGTSASAGARASSRRS